MLLTLVENILRAQSVLEELLTSGWLAIHCYVVRNFLTDQCIWKVVVTNRCASLFPKYWLGWCRALWNIDTVQLAIILPVQHGRIANCKLCWSSFSALELVIVLLVIDFVWRCRMLRFIQRGSLVSNSFATNCSCCAWSTLQPRIHLLSRLGHHHDFFPLLSTRLIIPECHFLHVLLLSVLSEWCLTASPLLSINITLMQAFHSWCLPRFRATDIITRD